MPQDAISAAKAAIAKGRLDDAKKLLDRWILANPADGAAIRARVQLALDGGRAGEVLPLLSAWTARSPKDASAWRLRAIAELEANDVGSVESWRQVLALKPDDVAVRVDLASALLLAGRAGEAEVELRKVLGQRPQWGAVHARLGEALLAKGDLAAAERSLRMGMALEPTDLRAPHLLARLLRDTGRPAEAVKILSGRTDPESVLARANALLESGDADGAVAGWKAALTLRPGWIEPLHNLGAELARRGDPEGLRLLSAAVLTPAAPAWVAVSFADAVGAVPELPAEDRAFRAAVERVLVAPGVDPSPLDRAVRAVLGDLLDQTPDRTPDIVLPWLERTLVRSVRAERFLVRLRDALVARLRAGDAVSEPLAAALAVQAHHGEHAWGGDPPPLPATPAGAALMATFVPVESLPPEHRAVLPDVLAARITRREREIARAEAMPSLGMSPDATSAAVRAMYEENPYPTLVYLHRKPKIPLAAAIRSLLPHADAPMPPPKPDILVAGCGTGQQALAATRYRDARITALDFSRRSLGIAADRAAEAGEEIRFLHADILGLGGWEERFDLVECGGVLHHLRDPMEGWRILRDLLRPRGWMKIALYSELGRPAVIAARECVASQGFEATPEGLRAARRALADLPDGHPARAIVHSPDYFSLSGFRDLVFHVQEHRFTIPQLAASLQALDLRFAGFQHARPEPSRWYAALFPNDRAMDSLERWESVESAHPETFAGMYQFWCVSAS